MGRSSIQIIYHVQLEGGTLLFAGATDWKLVGRKAGELSKSTNTQWSPTRLAALKDVKIVSVSKNCASANCFAIDEEGQVWAWGRNEAGQLGLGDTEDRCLHIYYLPSSGFVWTLVRKSRSKYPSISMMDVYINGNQLGSFPPL